MHLSRSILAFLAFLFMASACSGFPFFWRAANGNEGLMDPKRASSPARVMLELQNTQYDGEYLSGRLLIGVAEGQVTIDRRLIEHVSVQVESVLDCATGQPVAYIETDSFPKPATEEDFLTLAPGYWYGAGMRFFLFDEKFIGETAPDCIDVTLVLRAKDRHIAARMQVRAENPVPSSPAPGSTKRSSSENATSARRPIH